VIGALNVVLLVRLMIVTAYPLVYARARWLAEERFDVRTIGPDTKGVVFQGVIHPVDRDAKLVAEQSVSAHPERIESTYLGLQLSC
jgi:hypothetical protein